MKDTTVIEKPNGSLAPIIDSLYKICNKNIHSFHALPISSKNKEYKKEQYNCFEASITDEKFDNFFFSKNVIAHSQKLTSELYGSHGSFYITSGTTVANQISISLISMYVM